MKISNEAKIGIMVTAVLLILAVLTFKTGNFKVGSKGYTVTVLFQNIDGIDLNAPVMLNGFEVGAVKGIAFSEVEGVTKMALSVWLPENVQLKEGTRAYVKNMGFMGEKYVGLISGKKDGRILGEGSVIGGQEPADLDKLLSDGQEIAGQIKSISQNLNERLTKNKDAIDEIVVHLNSSMKHVDSISANIDERLTLNEDKIDNIIAHLNSSVINLDQFTYDLKLNPWKLMYRTKEQRKASLDQNQSTPSDRGQ